MPEADPSSIELGARFAAEALPLVSRPFGVALGMTQNRADAKDLVQKTYLEAYSRFHQHEPGTNITAQPYRIFTSTHISHYRRARRPPTRASTGGVEDQQLAEAASYDPIGLESAEVETLARMSSEMMKKALGAPSKEQRMVVVLADVDSLSYKEVATTLGIPIGTAMSRLHQGQTVLRRSLAHVAAEYGIGGYNE